MTRKGKKGRGALPSSLKGLVQRLGVPRPLPKGNKKRGKRRPGGGKPMANWLDPACKFKPPVSTPYGKGNYLQIRELDHVSTDTSLYRMLVISNDGVSGTYGMHIFDNGASATAMFSTSQCGIGQDATAAGMSAMKAARLGITVRNTTKQLNVAGEVGVWIPSNRVDIDNILSGDSALQSESISSFLNRPDLKMFTAVDFIHNKTFISFPVTEDYDQFKAPVGVLRAQNDWIENWRSLSNLEGLEARARHNRPMAPIILIFPPTSDVQTYSITTHLGYWVRYTIGSVGHYHAESMPVTDKASETTVRRVAEAEATGADMVAHSDHGGRGWLRKTPFVKSLEQHWHPKEALGAFTGILGQAATGLVLQNAGRRAMAGLASYAVPAAETLPMTALALA
jgi:hypothetical protein